MCAFGAVGTAISQGGKKIKNNRKVFENSNPALARPDSAALHCTALRCNCAHSRATFLSAWINFDIFLDADG